MSKMPEVIFDVANAGILATSSRNTSKVKDTRSDLQHVQIWDSTCVQRRDSSKGKSTRCTL
jgi:hypothetical protein